MFEVPFHPRLSPISFLFLIFIFDSRRIAFFISLSLSLSSLHFADCFQTEIPKKNSNVKNYAFCRETFLATICPEAGHFRAHCRESVFSRSPLFSSSPSRYRSRSAENWAGISKEAATKNGNRSIDRRDTAESATRSHPVIQRRQVHRAERKRESVLERGRNTLHGLFHSLSIAVQFSPLLHHFERFCSFARIQSNKIYKEEYFDSARGINFCFFRIYIRLN